METVHFVQWEQLAATRVMRCAFYRKQETAVIGLVRKIAKSEYYSLPTTIS